MGTNTHGRERCTSAYVTDEHVSISNIHVRMVIIHKPVGRTIFNGSIQNKVGIVTPCTVGHAETNPIFTVLVVRSLPA